MTFAQACTDRKSHGVGENKMIENKKIIIRNTAETGLQSSLLTCLIILREKRAQQHWHEIWHAWLLLTLTESPTLAAPFLLLFFWICRLGWRRHGRYGREDGQNPGASNLRQSTSKRERERASSWDQTFQTSEVEILAQNQLQTGPLPSHSSQRDDFFFYSSHLML